MPGRPPPVGARSALGMGRGNDWLKAGLEFPHLL